MHLTRYLAFISAKLDIHIVASHIRGINNTLADALSRNNLSLFRSLYIPAGQPRAHGHPSSVTGSASDNQARLDIQELDRAVERYFLNGLAESTRKAYGSSKKCYMALCMSKGLKPLPAKEHQICQFVRHLADSKLCHNTIKCYLSAIRHLHTSEGYGDPKISSMARLEQVLKGIKSHQAKAADTKKTTRLPIHLSCCSD